MSTDCQEKRAKKEPKPEELPLFSMYARQPAGEHLMSINPT
jgi:hypothetical protein